MTPIPVDVYADFAAGMFESHGKHIAKDVIGNVYDQFEGCTWFVQMMMNELFAITETGGTCDASKIETAWQNIIQIQENSYKDILSRLAPKQKTVLQAIAKEGNASGITAAAFIKKYSLVSASSVQSAIRPLLKNDIVTKNGDVYRVYDYFFASWLQRW